MGEGSRTRKPPRSRANSRHFASVAEISRLFESSSTGATTSAYRDKDIAGISGYADDSSTSSHARERANEPTNERANALSAGTSTCLSSHARGTARSNERMQIAAT